MWLRHDVKHANETEKGWTPEEAWAPFEFENACPFTTFRCDT
jgi:hypothetical protein